MNGSVLISSEYLEKMGYVYGNGYKQEIMVWVESDIDIRLWHSVFPEKSQKYEFIFRRSYECSSCDDKSANGCSRIAKLVKSGDIEIGPLVRICLDSDYRFILNDYSEPFSFVENNPYVYETLVHSRENIISHPDGFKTDLQRATSITSWLGNFDFEVFLNDFSLCIYNSYILALYLKSVKNENGDKAISLINESITENLSEKIKSSSLEMLSNYNSDIFFHDMRIDCSKIFEDFKHHASEAEINNFSSNIEKRIGGKDQLFYFYRGHDLYDKVVKKLFHQIQYHLLLQEKEKRITAGDSEGISQLYKTSIDIDKAVELRSTLHRCKFFTSTIDKIHSSLN